MVRWEDVAQQNLWWKHGNNFVGYDKDLCSLQQAIVPFRRKEITPEPSNNYIVQGPRRVGKTVWMKQNIARLIKEGKNPRNILFLSCDTLPSGKRKELGKTINMFLEQASEGNKFIFLDEISYIEGWEDELKTKHDGGMLSSTGVAITGSSALTLRKKAEAMPGRGIEGNSYFMKPLTFRQFVIEVINQRTSGFLSTGESEQYEAFERLKKLLPSIKVDFAQPLPQTIQQFHELMPFSKNIRKLFNIYLITGGFPKVINNFFYNSTQKKEEIDGPLYEEILTFVLGEVEKLGKDKTVAERILTLLAKKGSVKYSYNSLSKELETGISHIALADYLANLGKMYCTLTLKAFDFSKKTERPKADKKSYFTDPFILHALQARITGETAFKHSREFVEKEEQKSKLVEGIVAAHLAIAQEIPVMKESGTFLWFYYDQRGREIDFILKNAANSHIGIEVKYQRSPQLSELTTNPNIHNYYLLTEDEFDTSCENKIAVPVHVFLALLERSERHL